MGFGALNYLYNLNLSMKKASWFIIALFAIGCLDDPDCFQLNNNIIGISFRVLGSTKPDTLYLLRIEVPGTDSIFHDTPRATAVDLPLNFTKDQTDINFIQVGGTNFLNLGYVTKTQFVSDECGSRFILTDLKVLDHDFDSVRIVDPNPDKKARNNIEVYRCPNPVYLTVVFRDLYYNGTKEAYRAGSVQLTGITDSFSGTEHYTNSNQTTFYLRVDTTTNQTTFEFKQLDGSINTLTMDYARNYLKRYNPCDPGTYVSDLTIGSSSFVRSEIVKDQQGNLRKTITDPPEPNVYIYQCQRTNLLKIDFRERVSGTSSSQRADTVLLRNVSTNYTSEIFYANKPATTITVPLNEALGSTDIYLKYDYDLKNPKTRTDTLRLTYTRSNPTTLISDCGPQILFSDVNLTKTITGLTVKNDSLRFPPVTNIEILN